MANINEIVKSMGVIPTIERKVPPLNFVNPVVESVQQNKASQFHRRLIEYVKDFDDSLDQTAEVGVRLVSFGQTITFHLESMGYWDPSLIAFAGVTDNGDPIELIQHVSQISILLMKLPRREPDKPKKPIGFHSPAEAEDSGAAEQPST